MLGLALLAGGSALLLGRVVVVSSPARLWGVGSVSFTTLVLPIFVGVGLLFFQGRSILGWLLTLGGALALFATAIADLRLFFRPTSLPATLAMFGLMAAGLGQIARSLRAQGQRRGPQANAGR